MRSLAVKSPSWSHRPSPSRRALHHPQLAIAPSIAAHCRCALGPSPPRSRRPSLLRSRCAVHCRRGAVAPSITVAPSLAVEEPSHCSLPSPSMSHHVVPRRRGAAVPSIALEKPSRRTLPSRSRRPASCHVSLLLTPPPEICRRLRLSSRRCRLLSRPSRASRPAGQGVTSPHATATYLQ